MKRCERCGFKFEPVRNNAKVCPMCRQDRKDKWRKDRDKEKSTPKVVKPEEL